MKIQHNVMYGTALIIISILLFVARIELSLAAQSHIAIVRKDQVVVYFNVELAATPAQRARGLMWRSHLPRGSGMLFDFGQIQPITMWMKNTMVSLDMLFIDAAGIIVDIKESIAPQSTRLIHAGVPSRYVLEINAGEARLNGIEPGDRLEPIRNIAVYRDSAALVGRSKRASRPFPGAVSWCCGAPLGSD